VLPAAFGAIVASSATNAAFVFWIRERTGADSAATYGILIAAWSAGRLLGAAVTGPIASKTGLAPGAVTLTGAAGIGVAQALAGFHLPLVVIGVGWVSGGVANALHNISLRQLAHLSVPAEHQGAAFGEFASLTAVALLLGYAIGSAFGARAPSTLFLAGGCAGALIAVTGAVRLGADDP
jgi:MFS family permease